MGAGVIFDKKKDISRKGIEPTQVKSIKLISSLDDGAANDGTGAIKEKSGLIFGGTYTFKVESYTNEEPKDSDLIQWAVSYTDTETGKYYKNVLESTSRGDEVSITFNDKNGCGNNLEIKAYINDMEQEGKLVIFKHHRFRFFDRKQLLNELQSRKQDPWRINQDQTNTCGPSAIMYSFAKKDKESYAQFITDLHRKGFCQHNNYKIDISSDGDLKDIADTNPKTQQNFPATMASCDWIPNTCITDDENIFFDYEGNTKEDFSAITVPSRMKMLSEKLLGFTDVTDNTNLYFRKSGWAWGSTVEDIAELMNIKEEGYEVFLLVNMGLFSDKISGDFAFPEHWIVLENISHSQTDTGYVDITIYTWGRDPKTKYSYNKIRYEVFRSNYFGYVKAK
ncbi:MAG: hypothetical protein MUW56_13195 [Chryseobacterium sp.]|uniref:hypothetical protein n=1 Tax=Chryseobacterium sp. TaxID=1871047 RepID=UPI0025B7F30F|nr:hypothetical protein [Chryseobacterium sp.]MCJ7934550.1 hypothetical protein [Chryseobacterium sp.]